MTRAWLLLLPLVAAQSSCKARNDVTAEATAWAKSMGYQVQAVACMHVDSDQDGYASCAMRLGDLPAPLALECGLWSFSGCRLAQVKGPLQ